MCDLTSVCLNNSVVPQEQETKGCLLLLLSYLRSLPVGTSELSLLYANCQCMDNGRVDAQGTWQRRAERHQNIPIPLSGPLEIDFIRYENGAMEPGEIILVSLEPVEVEIK